jgi:molecular chaperone GrpE
MLVAEEKTEQQETGEVLAEEQAKDYEEPQIEGQPDLTNELKEKERLLEEQADRYKRLQADFDNFRRRTRQEKEELSGIVTQNILLSFLPVLDNFERAVTGGANQEAGALYSGVEMIYRQFAQAMEKSGLQTVEAVGELFDPQKHEAVMRVEDCDKPAGTIVEEFQKGYMVLGKVIRPSMVKVAGE